MDGIGKVGAALPYGDTGAEVASGVILDWLRGTLLGVDVRTGLVLVSDLVGDIVRLDRGWRGYSECGVVLGGGGFVAWDYGRPDMGVHLDLSGRGVAGLCERHGGDILGVLRYMCDLGFRFGRVDLAFDDTAGLLQMDAIAEHLIKEAVGTRWRKNTWTRTRGLVAGGDTISMGSRASDAYLRIYDKAKKEGVVGHWVRVELEMKRKRAHAVLVGLLEGGGAYVAGVLRGYVDFKDLASAGTVTRRSTVGWWSMFLRGVERLRLVVGDVERSLERVKNWIARQVAPSLALVVKGDGGGLDFILSCVTDGMGRLRPGQLALIS